MLLIILGLFDMVVGLALMFPRVFSFISFWLGICVLIKGILSLAGSFASRYYLDFMGAIDILAGVLLISGFSLPFFWFLPVLKGFYSIFSK
ncbi:MAG: hypothetical protein QXQ40_02095 [Candidatus Aenigmatarchaeota archaeon]